MVTKKKSPEELRWNKYLNRACREVNGFAELRQRFERNISIPGRSKRTFDNYSRHMAVMALHSQGLQQQLKVLRLQTKPATFIRRCPCAKQAYSPP